MNQKQSIKKQKQANRRVEELMEELYRKAKESNEDEASSSSEQG